MVAQTFCHWAGTTRPLTTVKFSVPTFSEEKGGTHTEINIRTDKKGIFQVETLKGKTYKE